MSDSPIASAKTISQFMGHASTLYETSDALALTAEEFGGHIIRIDGKPAAFIYLGDRHWTITNSEGTYLYKVARKTSPHRFAENVETKQQGTDLAIIFENSVE